MARPPSYVQRRYRGRQRRAMRSAYNHLAILLSWDAKFRNGPADKYPNQLAPLVEVQLMQSVALLLSQWLALKGPIPSRV